MAVRVARPRAVALSVDRVATLAPATVADVHDRRGRELFGLCRRLGLDEDEANDAVQEAFLRMWDQSSKGVAIVDPEAWAFRVTYRLAMDHHRFIRLARSVADRLSTRDEPVEVDAADRWAVWAAVDQLPTRQRAVLYLRYRADLSYERIAVVMGITAAGARNDASAATASLRTPAPGRRRHPMTRQFHALEKSLRDGPPDESGYVATPLELGRSSVGVRSRRAGPRAITGPLAPRRRHALVPTSWLVAMIAVAVGLGGLALLGRQGGVGASAPPASPSPSARPFASASGPAAVAVPPLTRSFVSPRNGFSVSYPLSWVVTPATTTWKPDTFLPIGNHALDQLARAGDGRLVVASRRLVAGETEESFVANYVCEYGGSSGCATKLANAPRLPIDGQSAYLDGNGDPMPADSRFSIPDVRFGAIVFAGDRIYTFGLDGNVDLDYFRAILATVRLDPASGVDTTSP